MEHLEKEIKDFNREKETIENEMNSGNLDAEALTDKAKRLSTIIELVDKNEMRWLELSEIEE